MKMRITLLPLLAILCLTLSAPAFAQTIFAGGPINGTLTALFITGPNQPNFKGSFQDISDGFMATSSGTPASLAFGAWVLGGDTPTVVSYEFGTSPFGTDLGNGTVPLNASTNLFLFGNTFGYDVYKITIPVSAVSMIGGNNYWVSLSNADDNAHSGSMAWDYNGGPATCNYRQSGTNLGNCASGATILAEHTTPQDGEGESFTLSGSQATTPEPSSILLFGSGILGLAGVLRRKLNI
jgi:hypothetical protein